MHRPAFRPRLFLWCGLLVTLLAGCSLAQADYSTHPQAQAFIAEMVEKEGLDRTAVQALLAQAKRQQAVIDLMSRPAEKTLTWGPYRDIFLQPDRIQAGAQFWHTHRAVLREMEAHYGVPPEIVVAIIGVETFYGRITGNFRVLDALATLAFDYPPRAKFFRSQLKHFLLLVREQNKDPLAFKGSYAGAMGLGQFIPRSYRNYAANYRDDGFIDLWDPQDAIWSVANYLTAPEHDWRRGQQIALPARLTGPLTDAAQAALFNGKLKPELSLAALRTLGIAATVKVPDDRALATPMRLNGHNGPEYWLGLHNFYALTRYNHSQLYAMAVHDLAAAVRTAYADRR